MKTLTVIKNKQQIISASSVFVALEILFAVSIHFINGRVNDFISVGSILSACLFAFLYFDKEKDYILVQAGLICTVFADVFLLIAEPENKLVAMLFFSVTQMCYFAILFFRDKKHRKAHLTLRIMTISAAIIITCAVLRTRTDALSLVSLFYFANIIINTIWAFTEHRTSCLFGPALLLFLLCDICVGLSVMSTDYISIGKDSILYFIINPGFNLAWAFYIPSQVLIVLSLAEVKLKKMKAVNK